MSVAVTKYSIKKRKNKRLDSKGKIYLNVPCKHQSQGGLIQNNPISAIVLSLLAKTIYLLLVNTVNNVSLMVNTVNNESLMAITVNNVSLMVNTVKNVSLIGL